MLANDMRARFLLQYEGARLGNRTFNDREIQDFLNKAQLETTKGRVDALKNRTQRGFESDKVRASELSGLVTSTHSINDNYFIQGTKDNGALRGPDLDQATQTAHQYGVFAAIPNECLYIINESVHTQNGTPTDKYNVPVKEISYNEYQSSIWDPYAKPYDNLSWSINWGTFTTAEYTGYSGSGVEATPEVISITPSSKEFTQDGTNYNMKGITSSSYIDGNTPASEEWIAFTTNRAKYLIPGKDWSIKEYVLHYVKIPSDIRIDIITPSNQVNCELAEFMHQDIVDMAVKLASASIIPEPNKYQVNDIETKMDE